jgi:tRNA-(ms[2]io[6]A)-hydroxylase
MLRLQSETSPEWLAQACENVDVLLVDHAHCEKKAASNALNFLFRYAQIPELQIPLSELAREEMEHFELVLRLIRKRGGELHKLEPSAYGGKLHAAVRKGDPAFLLDTLLVAALIEARSCERMRLLSRGLPDEEIRTMYGDLLASEARHHQLYVDLACALYARDEVMERLTALSAHEAECLRVPGPQLRMHS